MLVISLRVFIDALESSKYMMTGIREAGSQCVQGMATAMNV